MPFKSGVAADVDTAEAVDGTDITDRTLDPIEWGPVRHDRLRSLAAGFGVVLAGVLVAFAVGVAVVWGSALLAGGPDGFLTGVTPRGAFLAGVLVLAIATTVVPYAYLADRQVPLDRDSLRGGRLDPSTFRPAWVLAGVVVPAAAWWFGPAWLRSSGFSLVPLVWLIPMLAAQSGTTVRLDPTDAVIERTDVAADRTRTDDLDSVVRTRRVDLPRTGTTLFLLAYRGNAWYRSTPWLFVPRAVADDVEAALDEVLERSDGPDRASVPERVVLAIVGSSSLVFGVVMTVAAGEGAAGALLALLTTPFSLVFLALAARL